MSPPFTNRFPAAGTLVTTFCSGTTKMGTYNDGNGGTYNSVIQANSTDCGYVPPPAAGSLLSTSCSGTTKMGHYADGNGGTYDAVIQENSTDCGYDPNLQGGGGALRINAQWDGNADIDVHVTSPDGYEYGYGYSGGGNGVWDYDSMQAGQENVAWNPTAPNGAYTVQLINYNGNDPGNVKLTIILNGMTRVIDMTPYVTTDAHQEFARGVQFSISNGVFAAEPNLY